VLTAEARTLPRLLPTLVDGVVARGFGAPQEVVRAAAPILAEGGVLVVSEPPGGSDRWTSPLVSRYFTRAPAPAAMAILRRVPRGS
jgi:hypothetical protein